MKKLVDKILIITILCFFSSNLNADIPHYLDFKYILNESVAGKKAQKELKSKLDKGINSLKNKEKKLQDEEKNIIQQKKLLKQKSINQKLII
tara:strand:+ start:195 stop:470 length:276 start_codon:yes stop_codon:yes gene_type:complete